MRNGRRMNRPTFGPKKDNRVCGGGRETVHTHFVFSREEHDTLSKNAKQCGLTKSAYLRQLVMGKPVKARPPEAVHELYVEVNRIGVNINQIARACNTGADAKSAAAQALFLLGKVYALMDALAAG